MSLVRGVSGVPSVGSATPRSGQGGREVVSASLDGLVSALDGLKSSLGYDDYSTVRSLIEELRTENEELRTYAETAIREAQRLKDAYDGVADRLAQRELEDSVAKAAAESQRLASLADEFDREEASARREEVERAKREAEALRARILELEEENGALEGRVRRAERRAEEAGAVGAAGAAGAVAAGAVTVGRRRLHELEAQNEDLRREVASLTETMFGKTFKAPSAWAEREIRYKRDEQAWAEARRELEAELERVRAELRLAEDAEDTEDWRARIVSLEARLVESENERRGLASRLHELELRERARAGRELNARLLAALQERDALRGQLAAATGGDAEAAVAVARPSPGPRARRRRRPFGRGRRVGARARQRAAARCASAWPPPTASAGPRWARCARGCPLGAPSAEAVEGALEAREGAAALLQTLKPTLEAELLAVEEAIAAVQLEGEAEIAPDEDEIIGRLAELRDKKEAVLGKLLAMEAPTSVDAGGVVVDTEDVVAEDGALGAALDAHAANDDDLAGREAAEARLLASLISRNALLAELAAAEKEEAEEKVGKQGPALAPHTTATQPSASSSPRPGNVSRQSSGLSASGLAADRAAADAAWADYAAGSDLPALRRAKAELEARCALLEEQMTRMAGELREAGEQQADMEARVDAAVKTGDITPLKAAEATAAKKARAARPRLTLGKMFKNLGVGSRPASREGADEGIETGGSEELVKATPDAELQAARAENSMIMEHLVMTKVRMAELEGDYLETRRELLRAREKQLDLAKKLAAYKSGHAPPPAGPTRRHTAMAAVSSDDQGAGASEGSPVPSDRLIRAASAEASPLARFAASRRVAAEASQVDESAPAEEAAAGVSPAPKAASPAPKAGFLGSPLSATARALGIPGM
ncbi:hypothetical protein QBZ16_005513 [Prototheca wickerhamii]|uniref:Uncharacterized protein n=1 Tax=Prototheca wickerhamii TaxID=3111 RepID=A0AAD9IFN5_PROWI|nr:hypothetical protein QBZ16_005513 [Prototheca wickerhamii]